MKSKCLETRLRPDGLKRRRYEVDGVRFSTVEIPVTLLSQVLNYSRLNEALAGWHREMARKKRKVIAKRMLEQGEKFIVVAHELGISTSAVQKYAKEIGL